MSLGIGDQIKDMVKGGSSTSNTGAAKAQVQAALESAKGEAHNASDRVRAALAEAQMNPEKTSHGFGAIGAMIKDHMPGNSEFGHQQGYGAQIQQAMRNSAGVVASAMQSLQGAGVQGLQDKAKQAASQSLMSRWTDGPMIKPEDDLPNAPGFAYLNHLFNATGAGQKIKEKQKNNLTNGLNIMTNAMDGVRTALKMIGMAGDNNIDGLPIDMKDVLKIFHGDKADEMDDISRNEFMREIGDGNTKIDRKKVRKFVNQDGSLTWEILNDDKKTVMSRFTFGEYNGTKIFAQGGYKNFGQLLREARQKLGPDIRGEFDSIRKGY